MWHKSSHSLSCLPGQTATLNQHFLPAQPQYSLRTLYSKMHQWMGSVQILVAILYHSVCGYDIVQQIYV